MMLAIRDGWCIGGWVADTQLLVEAGKAAKRRFRNTSKLHILWKNAVSRQVPAKEIHKFIQNKGIELV